MKVTKKKLAASMFATTVLVISAVGCSDNPRPAVYENAKRLMSYPEKQLVTSNRHDDVYSPLYSKILSTRLEYPNTMNIPKDEAVPFCDVFETLKAVEEAADAKCSDANKVAFKESCIKYTLNKQWEVKYGKTLVEQCQTKVTNAKYNLEVLRQEQLKREQEIADAQEQKKREVLAEKNKDADTVIIGGERYIAPKLYKQARDSAVKCERSRLKFMELTEDEPYLSPDDYEVINKFILDCEVYLTEKAINEPRG